MIALSVQSMPGMSTIMPRAEFFFWDELEMLGEVAVPVLVPVEDTLLPDEEPEGVEEPLEGAGVATVKLSDIEAKSKLKSTHYQGP